MDLSIYARPRLFEQPRRGARETVGIWSVLWALVGGPIYYWKKGAMIEAIVLCVSSTPFWAFAGDGSSAGLAVLQDTTTLIWAASVLLAPVLLTMSYRRRGWTERADPDAAAD
jgi:hypothetical protein